MSQTRCAYTETNPIVFISHIIVPRHTTVSEIISNRCNRIWLCNRSLDGDTLRLQNGGCPSDVPESYTSSDLIAQIDDCFVFAMKEDDTTSGTRTEIRLGRSTFAHIGSITTEPS